MEALLAARGEADLHPTQCKEYFLLLCRMLRMQRSRGSGSESGEAGGGGGGGSGGEPNDAVAEELLARVGIES